jgi:hypothetical protein
MPGFALSLLALHMGAVPLGSWGALAAMVATSLLWSAGMMALHALRPRSIARPSVAGKA